MSWRVPGVQPTLRGHRSWSLKSPSDSSSDRCHSDRCTCSGRMELASELPLLPTSSSSRPSAARVMFLIFKPSQLSSCLAVCLLWECLFRHSHRCSQQSWTSLCQADSQGHPSQTEEKLKWSLLCLFLIWALMEAFLEARGVFC